VKKIAENISFALVILLMVAAVFTYLAPHLGWRVDAVLSGSMEPKLKTGAVVITQPADPEAIAVGDIITFRPTTVGENTISHRVLGIERSSSLYFRTKGDANEDPDPFIVPAQNLAGRICLHIPFLGYVTQFVKTPLGFSLALVIPGLLIVGLCMRNVWRHSR
jgi:signal peptidase